MDRRLARDLLFFAALLASAAFFYRVGYLPVAFLGLAAFTILTWFRIDLSLLAIIVFLPYFMAPKQVDHHPWPPSEWLMISVGLVALALCAASWLGFTRDSADPDNGIWSRPAGPDWRPLRASAFVLPGFIFLIAAFTSAMDARVLGLAAREFLEVVVEPIAFFCLLLVFTPLRDPRRRERSFLLIGIAVVITGTVPAFIGLAQLATQQHLVTVVGAGYRRIIGPYAGPNNFGLLLDRTIPMAVALVLVPSLFLGAKRDAHRPGGKWLAAYRGTFATAFAVMLATLIFTFVLGAWLGTAIAVVMLLVVRFRHGWWLVAAATLVLTAGVALGSGKAHSVTEGKRISIWISAIHMIRDHPILGIGLDNFQTYYAPRSGDGVGLNAKQQSGRCKHGLGYMLKNASNEPCFSHPHNFVLDFWLSTGIVGLAAFLWLQTVFWSILWRARALVNLSPVLLGTGGAMLASLLHGLVDNAYFLVDLSALMWLLFGVASMYATALTEQSAAPALVTEQPLVRTP